VDPVRVEEPSQSILLVEFAKDREALNRPAAPKPPRISRSEFLHAYRSAVERKFKILTSGDNVALSREALHTVLADKNYRCNRTPQTLAAGSLDDHTDRVPPVNSISLAMEQDRAAAATTPVRTDFSELWSGQHRMIAARRIINGDDPAIGHVFNDRCRSCSSELSPSEIARLPEALRKPRERNGIADTRHRRRPRVSEINHASETFRRLILRHPKCREIKIRIAIDQRAGHAHCELASLLLCWHPAPAQTMH